MQVYRLIFLVGTLSVALMASACSNGPDLTTPSQINTTKIKVKDQVVTETVSADHIDKAHVATTARNILRNGNEDVTMTIPYLPGDGEKAGDLGAAYKKAFAAEGVTHFSVALVPVTDSQDADKAVVSYQGLVAAEPSDCGRIPGYQGTETMDEVNSYQYGCETEADLSKMVDDPSDLLGKSNAPEANSRRYGPIIEPYMLGTPNQPIKPMATSSLQ